MYETFCFGYKKKEGENPALYLAATGNTLQIPPNKTENVKSWNAPTLRGAVVFVSVNPGEPDALLGLVREDQLGRRVGSLCEHNQRQLTASNAPTNIFFFCLISLNKKNR